MRNVTVAAVAKKVYSEEIHAYTMDLANNMLTVATGIGAEIDNEFVFEPQQIFTTTTLAGDDLADLLAENGGPDNLLPGKPANTFRKDDLWPLIDRVKSREKLVR